MRQFVWSIERHSNTQSSAWALGEILSIKYEIVDRDYEKAWALYCTRILDAITDWCVSCGIRNFGTGFTQIAIQVTFLDAKDAMLFKLRWHNA